MIELFIALFGGLFFGGKILNEKSKTKKIEQNNQNATDIYLSRKNNFEERVLDRKLEADLEDMIYHMDDYDMIWSEVSKAFNEMPWKKEDEKFICLHPEMVDIVFGKGTCTKKQKEQIVSNHRTEVLRIMMANRGKLTQKDVNKGIYTPGQCAPTVRLGEQWNTESANFVLWMNSKLKEHGIEEDIYLCINNEFFSINEETKTRSGKYVWFPEIPPNSKIHP